MTLTEYKRQPFKYGSNAEPYYIGEIWDTLSRKDRREIERQLKKGKIPDITDYL